MKKWWKGDISIDKCRECGRHTIYITLQHMALVYYDFGAVDEKLLWGFLIAISLPRIRIIK